mgnify:CR=1 FL=1
MRYRAFISYSHADQKWAAWLHRALESYRTPWRLVGKQGLHGAVPARMTPIFRDRDELSSSADLSETIQQALAESESLIVICSPNSVDSHWVNEEIRYFRSLGRGDRIYCLIVAGDPQASDPGQCCFPAALLEKHGDHAAEPAAADIRKWADGKALAKLKIAAGLLGVRLDELRQRELHRKRRFQALATILVLATMWLLGVTWQSKQAAKEAVLARQAQQASAENMLAEFLEQSKRFGEMADLETRQAFGEVLSGYLTNIESKDLTLESRRQLGVVLANNGIIFRDAGQLDQAMDAFINARQTLQPLVDDTPVNVEALFEMSQVEYWIGQVHLDRGDMQKADASFQAYADTSARLHKLDPNNADWTMEVAYAQSNLGNLEMRKSPSDAGLLLQYFREALHYNELAASQDEAYASELAESHAYLADAWLEVCNLEMATGHRQKNVDLAKDFFDRKPRNNRLKQDYAYALTGLSYVLQMAGQIERAQESLGMAIELQKTLVGVDPNNMKIRWQLMRITAVQAQILDWLGQRNESRRLSQSLLAEMMALSEQDPNMRIDHSMVYGRFLRDLAHRSYHDGQTTEAENYLLQAIQRLSGIATEHPESKGALRDLSLSYFYHWDHNQGSPPDTSASEWLQRTREAMNPSGCEDMDLATRYAVMENRLGDARSLADILREKGYREPDFVTFCAEHALCTQSFSQ